MATITVSNMRNKKQTVYAHDGHSVDIPGNAKEVLIDEKYDWNLPSTIVKKLPDVVFTNEKIEPVSNLEEAKKRAMARRNGGKVVDPVKVEDTPISSVSVEKSPIVVNSNTSEASRNLGNPT